MLLYLAPLATLAAQCMASPREKFAICRFYPHFYSSSAYDPPVKSQLLEEFVHSFPSLVTSQLLNVVCSQVFFPQAHYTVQPLPASRVTPSGEERRVKMIFCLFVFLTIFSCQLYATLSFSIMIFLCQLFEFLSPFPGLDFMSPRLNQK